MRKKAILYAAVVLAGGLSVALALNAHSSKASADAENSSSQGCVNQGADRRWGAPAVCWAQRHLSWKSDHKPHFLLIGHEQGTSIGLAWPPYLVYNSPDGDGQWRLFRIGFRYDRNWRGYIFPTMAWKRISNPLRY